VVVEAAGFFLDRAVQVVMVLFLAQPALEVRQIMVVVFTPTTPPAVVAEDGVRLAAVPVLIPLDCSRMPAQVAKLLN
jgi:hypothetical protein